MTTVSAADFAFLIAEGDSFDGSLSLSIVVGMLLGFFGVWALRRHTWRIAQEQATELIEVARREAAVAAEELKQKADLEIQEKRAELSGCS